MQTQRIKSMMVRFFAVGLVAAGFLLGSGIVEGGTPTAYAASPQLRPLNR
jgi:hypothetical protein